MSKNFELMQEALREAQQGTHGNAGSANFSLTDSDADRNTNETASDFDAVAQQECFKLVQRIFLTRPEDSPRSVVFAGVDRGNGCTRICLEAARILAANVTGSVCLVDANLRTPSLAKFSEIPDDSGLINSLREEGRVRDFLTQLKPDNLWLLSVGMTNAASPALLSSDRLKMRLQELRAEFDHVLIDTPALNLYPDAIAVGRLTDGAIVIVQAEATRRESAVKALQTLRDAQIEVLGAVLNRRTFPIPDFVYRRL